MPSKSSKKKHASTLKNQDEMDDIEAGHNRTNNPAYEPEENALSPRTGPGIRGEEICMEDLRQQAMDEEIASQSKKEKQKAKIDCLIRFFPILTMIFCFLAMILSAAMMAQTGKWEQPINFDYTEDTPYMTWCSDLKTRLSELQENPTPVTGMCTAPTLVLAGSVIAMVFTVVQLPPIQRCGKYMVIWAILIWMSSVILFAGFIVGLVRIPYDEIDPIVKASKIKYSYDKLASCDPGGYCWDSTLKNLYAVESLAWTADNGTEDGGEGLLGAEVDCEPCTQPRGRGGL